jgi:homoserine dehydrogenase
VKQVRIGIAGLGTVAQGVLGIIKDNGSLIAGRAGIDLGVARVASRTPKPEIDLLGASFSTSLPDLYQDPDVDLVVELIGGDTVAKDLIEQSLAAGKPVVTANKAVIALHGNHLFASNRQVPLKFEAAVAGAIPIIQAIQQGLVANRFEHVMGIINGTCNYILTAMDVQGMSFEDALAKAQELGFAEADPTFDVEGIDAAHKLTILLALAFDTEFNFDNVYVEGISKVTAEDIRYADELGYRIKHLGIVRDTGDGLEARVHPTLVPKSELLANVANEQNAVLVKSDAAASTLFSGPGAGGAATASAVLADVVAIARTLGSDENGRAAPLDAGPRIVPMKDVVCPNYLRIPTLDRPGVFAQVANALSSHDISIEAAIQKEPQAAQDSVAIVMLTNETSEDAVNAAMDEVARLDDVTGEIARIRVESL